MNRLQESAMTKPVIMLLLPLCILFGSSQYYGFTVDVVMAATEANGQITSLEQAKIAYKNKDYKTAFSLFSSLADQGNVEAQYDLGWMYYEGLGTERNIENALLWYKKAGEKKVLKAQLNLAAIYSKGVDVVQDYVEAAKWWRMAAYNGDVDAQIQLALLYTNGQGVKQDGVKAIKWYQKAAEQGNASAQYNLGEIYAKGKGVPKDVAKAVDWYQKAAEQGDANAQFRVGAMYDEGSGVPKDITKSVEWVQKAAAQGHAGAQLSLGMYYAKGQDVPKDMAKAVEWYLKAAEQGSIEAQLSLGKIYSDFGSPSFDEVKASKWLTKAAEQGDVEAQAALAFKYYLSIFGHGSPSDYAKSFKWAQKAAISGDVVSKYILGSLYLDGKGVSKDDSKGFEWIHSAAEDGHIVSMYYVASLYANGAGVPKNEKLAFEWYLKAASNGNQYAQNNLGVAYEFGDGVVRNETLAYAWYNLAAAQGEKLAIKSRDRIEKRITPDQRAEGQFLASHWKKGDTLRTDASSKAELPAIKNMPERPKIPEKQGSGTAFAVSADWLALTNYHVIRGCAEVKVAGREGVAKIITSDAVNDLALLQLPDKGEGFATFNPNPGKVRQGDDVIVFGYPLNYVLSSGGNLTPGIVSALTGLGNNTNQLQITAPIQPGSSGSPVMDKKGDVVGVVSMKLDDSKMTKATGQVGQNVNFAVSGQTVRTFLDTNKVPYNIGGGFFSREKSNADIADAARKWTVVVECWK